MPDGNITKKLLADSLKELLAHSAFHKITVGDICTGCGMSRKSFYYHFKDKYDLVNWIFITEYANDALSQINYRDSWEAFEHTCNYFYEHREFYRKVLVGEEQNSFSESLQIFLESVLQIYIKEIIGETDNLNFYATFLADAMIMAIKRWIMEKDCVPPRKFLTLIYSCITTFSRVVLENWAKEGADYEK